ncbi:MAG: hypothetical protein ABI554_07510 [Flavobacterium sp.]
MNKSLLIILLCMPIVGFSQVSYSSWTNSYMQINSYNGNSNPDAYTVKLDGNGDINKPRWKLSVRLKQAIVSQDGNYKIPSNKISFQPISTTGQSYPNPIPSISQIGALPNVILQDNSEVFLIPDSKAPLFNKPNTPNGYYYIDIKYGITLIGGAYLGKFPAWIDFYAPIEFTVYDQYNNVIGKKTETFRFQIGNITDSPPAADELSLKVNMNAANGVLEFKTMQDYRNGTSVTYTDGILVNSTSNFQIKVRSLQSNLQSAAGNSIPVDVIHLSLITAAAANQQISPIVLSVSSQALAKTNTSSTNNKAYRYDIKYFTVGQDLRLINAKSDNYSTTLQYEITPQ